MGEPKLTGFGRDYRTEEPLSLPIGRLILRSGHIVRMMLAPDSPNKKGGLVLAITQQAVEYGSLILYDSGPDVGFMPCDSEENKNVE